VAQLTLQNVANHTDKSLLVYYFCGQTKKHTETKMKKVIAAFNMTLDGICDHTTGVVDEGLHQHYSELIDGGGVILYGRTTYQLMQFWQTLLQNPSDKKSMDDFAVSIDKIQKLVFSNTLKETGWKSAQLAKRPLDEEVFELKKQAGKDILVGSRSLIIQLLNSNLIDELQICIHPIIEGTGLLLFDKIKDRIMLKLIKTKPFNSGATVFYYEPTPEKTKNS
jgi:dihydrofolate reductase